MHPVSLILALACKEGSEYYIGVSSNLHPPHVPQIYTRLDLDGELERHIISPPEKH